MRCDSEPTGTFIRSFFLHSISFALYIVIGICFCSSAMAASDSTKRVFAHYMLCCGIDGLHTTLEEYRTTIQAAQRAGIDGFVVNLGAWSKEPAYQNAAQTLFDAANGSGAPFVLLFSFDLNGGRLSIDDAVDIIHRYATHPRYFRIDGYPVVTTYLGTPSWGKELRQRLKTEGINIFFVAGYRQISTPGYRQTSVETPTESDVAALLASDSGVDGWNYFGAAGPASSVASSSSFFAKQTKEIGKYYLAPVSPLYRGLGKNYRIFDGQGFLGMEREWKVAIDGDAAWVQLVTWNDWGESTYLGPSNWPLSRHDRYARQWGDLADHDAFLRASSFWIHWFKTGSAPKIDADHVFYFYRPHLKGDEGISQPSIEAPAKSRPANWRSLIDEIYIYAYLVEPLELTITTGEKTESMSLSAGLAHSSVSLTNGPIRIRAYRNGRLISETQLPSVESENAIKFNFNTLSGELPLRSH